MKVVTKQMINDLYKINIRSNRSLQNLKIKLHVLKNSLKYYLQVWNVNRINDNNNQS